MEHTELFWLIVTFPVLIGVFSIGKLMPWIPACRFWSLVPYSIFGGFAIHLYHNVRTSAELRGLPDSRYVQVSEGINGVVGIMGAVWALVSSFMLNNVEPGTTSRKKTGARCLWVLLIDLAGLAALITAAAYSFKFLPGRAGICSSTEVLTSPLFSAIGNAINESAEGGCKRTVVVQSLGILVIILMGVQALLLLPHVVAPAPVRALVFFAIGLIQGKGKGAMSEEGWIKEKEAPSVGSHALSNVVERHISTCEGDGKGECWGCSKPICDDCKQARYVPTPRTTAHAANCFAVCMRCYLTRLSVDPAPLSAIWHSGDLALQHPNCQVLKNVLQPMQVDLCSQCDSLSPEDVGRLKEQKQEAVIRVMSSRKLRCAKCDVSLPKKRRRWWVCGKCDQECHWAGHHPSSP